MEKFVWAIGENKDTSIEFKKGRMVYYEELKPANDIKDVMYFYYKVLLRVGKQHLHFSVGDHPKVQYLSQYIEALVNHDTWNEGYLLEDTTWGNFNRKVRYHQFEIDDTFLTEYFIRLEKYCYKVTQSSEDTPTYTTVYKMTIGEIDKKITSEAGMVCFFNYIKEEELLEFGKLAESFCKHVITTQNEQNKKDFLS